MSADEELKAQAIGKRVGRSDQQVRQILHTFNSEGISCLHSKADQRAYDDDARENLRAIIRQFPRTHDEENSLWT